MTGTNGHGADPTSAAGPNRLPKPSSLGELLRPQLPPQQPKSANTALTEIPEVIDMSAWYEQHVALLHQFLHRTLWAIANTPARRNTRLLKLLELAHAELREHTRKIAGGAVPKVLARDGQNTISYEKLAEARAQVRVLTAELKQAREELSAAKVEGWRPEFDVISQRQEELVIQFCQEIAGTHDKPGSPPDPVRLLEMAEALYEAERESFASLRQEAP